MEIKVKHTDKEYLIRVEYNTSMSLWMISVFSRPSGKRKWIHILNFDDWEYRKMTTEERASFRKSELLKIFSEDEVMGFIRQCAEEMINHDFYV